MLERIKKFIDAQNLSSSAFANEIGVQRSSVSHVLSGRNKPSLDFVIKIKERYPDVNLDWLLSGKGGMISAKGKKDTENFQSEKVVFKNEVDESDQQSFEFDKLNQVKESINLADKQTVRDEAPVYYGNLKEKKIKKIILLYQDNSFEEFDPNK